MVMYLWASSGVKKSSMKQTEPLLVATRLVMLVVLRRRAAYTDLILFLFLLLRIIVSLVVYGASDVDGVVRTFYNM